MLNQKLEDGYFEVNPKSEFNLKQFITGSTIYENLQVTSMASLLFPDLLDLLVLEKNLTKNLRLNISDLRLVDKASIHKFFPEKVTNIKI